MTVTDANGAETEWMVEGDQRPGASVRTVGDGVEEALHRELRVHRRRVPHAALDRHRRGVN